MRAEPVFNAQLGAAHLGELLGDVDRVLTGHRIDHEQDVMRVDGLLDVGQLGHELGVDVQAAAGVHDEDVLALRAGALGGPLGDVHGVAVGPLLIDVHAGLLADLDQLVHRGGPVDVAGGHRH